MPHLAGSRGIALSGGAMATLTGPGGGKSVDRAWRLPDYRLDASPASQMWHWGPQQATKTPIERKYRMAIKLERIGHCLCGCRMSAPKGST